MNDNNAINKRLDKLNNFIKTISGIIGVLVYLYLPNDFTEKIIISIITPFGAYTIISTIIKFLINNIQFLLKIFWGEYYIAGIWLYTYTIKGKLYYGYNRLTQDIYGVMFEGSGIFPDGSEIGLQRSKVSSAHPALIQDNHTIIFLNKRRRTELETGSDDCYSKTSFTLDMPIKRKYSMISYPTRIHAYTVVYGGVNNGAIHKDCELLKHENIKTVYEARVELMKMAKKNNEENIELPVS